MCKCVITHIRVATVVRRTAIIMDRFGIGKAERLYYILMKQLVVHVAESVVLLLVKVYEFSIRTTDGRRQRRTQVTRRGYTAPPRKLFKKTF